MRFAQALALGAWVLVLAWLVLFIADQVSAAGWCLVGAGLLLFVAGPIFRRDGEGQTRVTGLTMLLAGVFFAAFGLVLAL